MPVRDFYEKEGDIFSRFNGFGLRGEDEAFYQYYRDKVSIHFDSVSGISNLNDVTLKLEMPETESKWMDTLSR